MIVGFLINTCEPFYRGGYERRAWAFARELAKQGHDVRIYTSCSKDVTIEGVHFVKLAPPRAFFNQRGIRNGIADLLFALSILRLLRKLRRRELDVLDVCATPFLHLPIAALIARAKQIPLVLTCHEALLSSLPAYVRERGHGSKIGARVSTAALAGIYRLGMSSSSQRIAVSRQTADALEKENFPAGVVVEFGLDDESFSPDLPISHSDRARFVFCGRLTPIKSVDKSIKALSSFREDGAAWSLEIIGTGSEESRLKTLAAVSLVGGSIRFHGDVSEEIKRGIFSQSEVFLLSSPREGFSIATLEAMAQGCCALVVSDPQRPNGALDFVEDGKEGLCIGLEDEQMSEALRVLLRDSGMRLRMRRAAWTKASSYRIGKQVERLIEFYRRLKAAGS